MATTKPDLLAVSIDALPDFAENDVQVSMLRLDKIHPLVSGNKWFKLKGNIAQAKAAGNIGLLSFGGAYSNHLLALAHAAADAGFRCVGVVRGDELHADANPVLRACAELDMQLKFISRTDYAQKHTPDALLYWQQHFPNFHIIPEGGLNDAGVAGAAEIAEHIPQQYDVAAVSVGSATTLCGLRNALPKNVQVFGFIPFKGSDDASAAIERFVSPEARANIMLTDRFSFGGFGRFTDELRVFAQAFATRYGFPLDGVYTAKMMFGVKTLAAENVFPAGTRVLCIHTGGLTGNVHF